MSISNPTVRLVYADPFLDNAFAKDEVTHMPLNQAQRDYITPYIEHFFYDLSTDHDTIASLKKALEKPLIPASAEQKEPEEKSSETDLDFSQLQNFIKNTPEQIKKKKIYIEASKKDEEKALEDLNPEPITIHDVTEYIIFYSVCCLHFHLEQTEDDFNLNNWLKKHNITEAELNTPWQPQNWLEKTGTIEKVENATGWNINMLLALLHNKNNLAFHSVEPEGESDWTLPELKGRNYSAQIIPQTYTPTDKDGNPLPETTALDVEIQVYISPDRTLKRVFSDATPYPKAKPPEPNETQAERHSRIANNTWRHDDAKETLEICAESYATDIIVNYLKTIGIAAPPKSPTLAALLLEDFPLLSGHAPDASSAASPIVEKSGPGSVAMQMLPADIDILALGLKLLTYQFYFDEFKAGRLSAYTLESLSEEETTLLTDDTIRGLIEHHDLTILGSLALKPSVAAVLKDTPYYLSHILQHPEDLERLKNIDDDRARFLKSLITNLLIQGKMLLQTALTISPVAFPLFTRVSYANYISQHPEIIPLLQNLSLEQQQFLLHETIIDMIERELLTLPTALQLTTAHAPIITHELYKPAFLSNKQLFESLSCFNDKKIALLCDQDILDLIKLKILPAEKALSYTEEQLKLHIQKNTLLLLRRRKLSTKVVAKFTSGFSYVVESEPYGRFLRDHNDNKPHPLFSLPDETLKQLHWISVRNLMIAKVLHIEDITSAEPNFTNRLCNDSIYNLLIEKKISAKQVAKLTEATAQKIEANRDIYYWLANSNDYNESDDYIPFKVWSKILCDDLIKAFQKEKPSLEYPHTHTNDRANSIATIEKISEDVLRAKTIALFMQHIAEQIAEKIRATPVEQIDAIYPTIQQTIATENSKAEPNWLEAFATIAEEADQRLQVAKSAAFKAKLRPAALGIFSASSSSSSSPPKPAEDFCTRLIHMAGFLQPTAPEQKQAAEEQEQALNSPRVTH